MPFLYASRKEERDLFAHWRRLQSSNPSGPYKKVPLSKAQYDQYFTWVTASPGPTGYNEAQTILTHNRMVRMRNAAKMTDDGNDPPNTEDNCSPNPTFLAVQLQIPSLCPHYLYPGCPQHLAHCPGCRVQRLLRELQRATAQWRLRGGPGPNPDGVSSWYVLKRRQWIKAKCQLVQYMFTLEEWVELEQAWEKEHQDEWKAVSEDDKEFIKSATEALYRARRECPLLEVEESDFEGCERGRDQGGLEEGEQEVKKEKKKVAWDDGIPECERRRGSKFLRTHQQYEPGRWAAESGRSWLNTSFLLERMLGDPQHDRWLDRIWEAGANMTSAKDVSETTVGEVTEGIEVLEIAGNLTVE